MTTEADLDRDALDGVETPMTNMWGIEFSYGPHGKDRKRFILCEKDSEQTFRLTPLGPEDQAVVYESRDVARASSRKYRNHPFVREHIAQGAGRIAVRECKIAVAGVNRVEEPEIIVTYPLGLSPFCVELPDGRFVAVDCGEPVKLSVGNQQAVRITPKHVAQAYRAALRTAVKHARTLAEQAKKE